jgi:PIN domain nuclease of toxin-antitoxin system
VISAVFDASAVIAVLREEEGSERILEYLPYGLISAVNLAEVFSKSVDIQLTLEQAKWAVQRLQLRPVLFDGELAYVTGSLREPTRDRGLSLGDRACLALGIARQVPVVTRERAWADLDIGVDVLVIR